MKGLILSGGAGTRLRPITHTSAKQLVPIANKPILFYGVEAMARAGIREIGIVVGHTESEIREAVGDGSTWDVEVTYLPQEAPLGLAHAVLIAHDFLGDEPFVMYLGDNMLEQDLGQFVDGFTGGIASGPSARILLKKVPNPRMFGVAEMDGSGAISRLVEKPDEPLSDLALVGVYLFGSKIHEAVRSITPSERGELEITDAIQWLIDRGDVVDHHELHGWWIDTGKKDPLLECNQLVLESLSTSITGSIEGSSTIDGEVVIGAGARIVDSHLRGPLVVGEDTVVEGSELGPFASIGDRCEVRGSCIRHSVLLDGVRVSNLTDLTRSLIGREAVVEGPSSTTVQLMVGDHSVVSLQGGSDG